MIKTRFTELIGCERPLQLAGMGWISGPELAVAVSEAGGLGMLALPMLPADALAEVLDDVGGRTAKPVGLNVLAPFLDPEAVRVAASRVRLLEFFYGDPDPDLVSIAHDGGALAGWQVGSLDEARTAAGAGCDLVVVQGTEAGGHVRGTEPLFPLLGRVLDAVDVPVVAAGGIATARTTAAALAAGASAVRVGTRFVAAAEADAHPDYVDALLGARGTDTVLTTAFSEGWPDAPHRVLRSAVERAESLEGETVGETELVGARIPVPRLSPMSATRNVSGDVMAMALYAGQAVDEVTRAQPAAEIVRELCEGAERLLRGAMG